MENILYTLQAFAYGIRITIVSLFYNQLIWGFVLGFITSTIIHLFVATDLAYSVTEALKTKIKKSLSKKITLLDKELLPTSLSSQKEYIRLRMIFYCMFILFLSVLFLLLLKF